MTYLYPASSLAGLPLGGRQPGAGLAGPYEDIQTFLGGGRLLPTRPSREWLTRLSLYGVFLQLQLRPYQIEHLLTSDEDLVEVFRQAEAAAIAAQAGEMQMATSIGAGVGQLVGQLAVKLGAVTGVAGAGVAMSIGLMIQTITQAVARSEDCIEGVTQQWFDAHRFRLRDKIDAMKPYLHDGLDWARDGVPHVEGVSAADSTTPDNQWRKHKVDFVFGWLRNQAQYRTESSLLTVYGMLACMSDSITGQPSRDEKRQLGSVYYASLIGMIEAWWRLVGAFGAKESFDLYCPQGTERCPVGPGCSGQPGSPCCHTDSWCTAFDKVVKQGYRQDATWEKRDEPLRVDPLGRPAVPQWAPLLETYNIEGLVTVLLRRLNNDERSRYQQDRYWAWGSNVIAPMQRRVSTEPRSRLRLAAPGGAAWGLKEWAMVVGGLGALGALAWWLSAPKEE